MTELRNIRALVELLTTPERRHLLLLVLLLVLSGGLEILGLGTVFVFTGILNELALGGDINFRIGGFDPQTNRWSAQTFATVGGLTLIGVFVMKACLILGVQMLMMRFIFRVYQRFSTKLFAGYLSAPLSFHIERSIAEIQRNLNIEPSTIFNFAAVSLVYLASNGIAITCLFAVLCFIDPLSSLLALALLGVVGGIYYSLIRRHLLALGRQRHVHIAAAIKWVGHAIAGIREVRLIGAEPFFKRGFQEQVGAVAAADRSIRIASQIPGLINEGALVVGIVGLMLVYLSSGRNVPELLPILATFGLAGVRMMGMATSMVTHIQHLQFHGPAIQAMRNLRDELNTYTETGPAVGVGEANFTRSIVLKNISYRYPHALIGTLHDVSLEVPKRSRIALLGASGSGKTTLLSILLGLLEPSSGVLLVDDAQISANLRSRVARLAYVPQTIFILDDTVRANVLFGRQGEDEKIWEVLEEAQIAEFVRKLPLGLSTVLGDNGAKLSGGERQRIAIARALLEQPDLLVLDEATSALDRETERKVLDAIADHHPDMTLVIATHRIESVQAYARRYLLREGLLFDVSECGERNVASAANQ